MAAIRLMLLAILVCSLTDGYRLKKRFLFYNPGDQSTALGYQNHVVQDMTSLVNEASGVAHAGNTQGGQAASGTYNVPNFPAMGQNPSLLQTGSLSSSASGASGSVASGQNGGSGSTVSGQSGGAGTPFSASNSGGSASFHGTNQWRCDAHVVATCDTQCLDVDPKDGCPFCIPGCHSNIAASSQSTGQGSQSSGTNSGQSASGNQLNNAGTVANGNSQSGSQTQNPGTLNGGSSQSGGLSQNPGTLSGGSSQSGNSQSGGLSQNPGTLAGGSPSQTGGLGQQTGTLVGTSGQTGAGLGGNLIQQPSGLAGTGGNGQGAPSNQGTSGSSGNTAGGTNTAVCPHFPTNCPKVYTALDKNGCLVCTILSKSSQTTAAPAQTTSTQNMPPQRTCAPKRCVPPCDKGIVLDSQGCPQCLCPAHI